MINNWLKVVIVLGFIVGINCKVRYMNGKNDQIKGTEINIIKKGGCESGLLMREKANTELFSWMVNIYVIVNTPDRRIRSSSYFYGTIIHPKVVITLASFAPSDPADAIVTTPTDGVEKNYQERMVSKIYKHKNYESKIFMMTAYDVNAYDFAILILFTPFYINGLVNTVCLPNKYSIIDTNDCYSLYATIEGFEDIKMKRNKHKLVATDRCKEFDISNKLSVFHHSFACSESEITQNNLCGFGNAVPLVCKNKNSMNYYLTGISINRCHDKSNATLNANIIHVSRWIEDVLNEEQLSH